jgi:hypothetical protein
MSRSVVTNCLYHMKAHGLIAANPSKMLVGKRPNLPTRGAWHANSYDITKKGLEYLEVRI